MRRGIDQLTEEILVESLVENNGMYHATVRSIRQKHDIPITMDHLKRHITLWGMEDFVHEIRAGMVENCFSKTYEKGVQKGDNQCLFYVMDKFGHHLEFLPEREIETESNKGWQNILGIIKDSSEPEAASEHHEE